MLALQEKYKKMEREEVRAELWRTEDADAVGHGIVSRVLEIGRTASPVSGFEGWECCGHYALSVPGGTIPADRQIAAFLTVEMSTDR